MKQKAFKNLKKKKKHRIRNQQPLLQFFSVKSINGFSTKIETYLIEGNELTVIRKSGIGSFSLIIVC